MDASTTWSHDERDARAIRRRGWTLALLTIAYFFSFMDRQILAILLEAIKADLALELEAVAQLREAIAYCESVRDFVSRDLFAEILENEEEHVDTLERQFEMIERMGLENYIALNAKSEYDVKEG